MRFRNGFIRMDREFRDRFFKGDSLGHDLFFYLVSQMEWDQEKVTYYNKGRHSYPVKFGEFVTTKKTIADDLGVDRRKVTQKIDMLKRFNLISVENLYNCTMFKLCSTYMYLILTPLGHHSDTTCTTNEQTNNIQKNKQTNPIDINHQPKNSSAQIDQFDSEGTKVLFDDAQDNKNTPPAADTGSSDTLIPNEPKIEKKAPRKPRTKKMNYSSNHLRLGHIWHDRSVQRVSNPHKSWSPEYFAEHIAKAQKRAGISDEVLERVVNFCTTDYFWSKNCLSPTSLLKSKDQVLRIDTILNQLITKTDMEMHNINNMGHITPEEARELNPFL